MLKVKISSVDPYSKVLSLQSPACRGGWENCEFFIDTHTPNCDYWITFNNLPEKEFGFCSRENTILVTTEPYNVHKYSKKYLQQFGAIITAQEELHHYHAIKTHQLLGWWVNKSYDDLMMMNPINKSALISLVVSNKRITREHELRYQFALGLKDYFGD